MSDWDRTKESLLDELGELRRQVVLLRTLAGFEKAQMCCQTLDLEGRIIDINRAWADLLGFSRPEVSGRRFVDFVLPEYREAFAEDFLIPAAGGENMGLELKLLHKDGSLVHVLIGGSRVRDQQGNFSEIYCILHDITGRRKVEEALLTERKRLYAVLDELPAIIYLQAPDYTIPFANRLFRERYGNPEGRYCYDIMHGLSAPCADCRTFLPFTTGRPQVWETVKPSGQTLQIYDYPFYDIDGSPLVLELGIDISDRKLAEEMLLSANRQFQDIIEFLPDATLVIDGESRVIAWNRAMEDMTGIKKGDMLGRGEYAYAVPFYGEPRPMLIDLTGLGREHIDLLYKNVEVIGDTLCYEAYSPYIFGGRGAYISGLASGFFNSDGKRIGAIECIRDISKQKESEERLRSAEEKYRTVVDNASEAIFVLQDDGIFKFGNPRALNFGGYTKEELLARSIVGVVHPEERSVMIDRYKRRLSGEKFPSTHSYRLFDKEGKMRWIDVCSVLITWEGRPATLNFVTDITERRRAEDALRESEEKYRTILNSIEDGYFEVDLNGNLVYFNNSLCKISGYPHRELIGENYRKFTPREGIAKLFKAFNKVFETGIPERLFDWELIKKDGTRGFLEASVSPVINSGGKIKGFRSVVRDVTERKTAEEQLMFLSLHDPLTGLYNRAYFEQEMQRLAGGRNFPVGIIMCDVDGLKLVNDTLGHEAGDRLLKEAAAVLKGSFRSSDVVSRIGGDEFAILLAHSRLEIEQAVGRIKKAVNNRNEANPDLPLSLSMGLAVSENASDMKNLFSEADNNMYREKLHSSQSARSAIVMTLMKALEARDFITEGHAERLQGLVADLAKEIGLPEHRVTDMKLLAQFHDIGKVGISDIILFKNGPLTAAEKNEMQRHCEIGHRIAQSLPDMTAIADWILKHHEWWNGEGYPLGLSGERIPLECRMLAIADAYDAMTSDRPYRKAMSPDEAVRELQKNAGTQFDPLLVPLFVRLQKRLREG